MPRTRNRPIATLENRGSLITYRDRDGNDRCLGYLMSFRDRGTYDPTFGRVEVSQEEAETHNRLRSEAEINGLDERCEIGMRGMFSLCPGRPQRVATWTGAVVSDQVTVHGQVITFFRNGKAFRGRLAKDSNAFHFRRIS